MMKNGKLSFSDAYTIFALSIQFVLQIVFAYVLKIDAAGRLSMFLLFSAFLINISRVSWSFAKGPLILYCILSVYLFVNGIVQKGYLLYDVSPVLQMFRKTITPPVFLILCAVMLRRKEAQTIRALYYSTSFFLLIYCFFRLSGVQSSINENSAALVLIANVILLCYGRFNNVFKSKLFFILAGLSLLESIIIGSRMGLGVIFYLYLCFSILRMSGKISAAKLIVFITSVLFLAVSLLIILKNTEVGSRIMGTTEQTEKFSVLTGTILDKFGDRGLQYYFSWPYFVASPVFGIGLNNWILYNPVDTICHSEYLVQYLENGLVAFIPFILFLYLLMHSLHKEYRKRKDTSRMSMKFVYLSMFGILFCNLVIWTNDQYAVFVIYALCYALSRERHLYRIKQV